MVKNFPTRKGVFCFSANLCNYLDFYGLSVNESWLWGITGCHGFQYDSEHTEYGEIIHGRNGTFEAIFNRLNKALYTPLVKYRVQKSHNLMRMLVEIISQNRPVIIWINDIHLQHSINFKKVDCIRPCILLSIDELLPLLPSRMRRTLKRGLTPAQNKLLQDIRSGKEGNIIKTHCRDMVILPEFIGQNILIHDGKEFQRVNIQPQMIGHYLGEFALTRKKVKHTGPGVGATRSSKFMPLK